MIFKECELCHATLDPGEKCTCREEAAEEARRADVRRRAGVTAMLLGAKAAPARGKKKRP